MTDRPADWPDRGRTGPTRTRVWLRRGVALAIVVAIGLVAWLVVAASSREPRTGTAVTAVPSTFAPPPTSPSPEPTAPPLPVCAYGDTPTERIAYRAWKRTLLDTTFSLPGSYVPPQLVSTTEAGFDEDLPIRAVVVEDLAELRRAAQAAGTPVGLIAAYRSHEQQAALFERREAELGHEGALRKTARPGHSEHQLGTALDFKLPGHQDVSVAFGPSPAGRWLATHGWEFGFVLSYPSSEQDVTCYAYEPWHYRYFGKETAARIHESGLITRQYRWQLQFDAVPEAAA